MKGSRFSEEQIIGILREYEAGAKTQEVCVRHGISDATKRGVTITTIAARTRASAR
jgi:hypothetical protein